MTCDAGCCCAPCVDDVGTRGTCWAAVRGSPWLYAWDGGLGENFTIGSVCVVIVGGLGRGRDNGIGVEVLRPALDL
jgi:hypothetical protein